MNRALIDTNIYSLALRGDKQVADSLRRLELIGFSVISIGELLAGFKAGNRESKNRTELLRFLDSPRAQIFSIDESTAEFYSIILHQLKNSGTPIPTNDLWIAATAFQHGLPLFTRDGHFRRVQNLGIYL